MIERKNNLYLIIFVILIFIIGGILTYNTYINNQQESATRYSYFLLETEPENATINYTLLVPIPLFPNGSVAFTEKDCSFMEGSGEISINQTEHGPMLLLKAKNPVTLMVKKKLEGNLSPSLHIYETYSSNNTPHSGKYFVWIYCKKGREEPINLYLMMHNTNDYYATEINVTIVETGWIKANIDKIPVAQPCDMMAGEIEKTNFSSAFPEFINVRANLI